MNKEKLITLTKVMVVVTLLWELYGPSINHHSILYFIFPCILYFAYYAFRNDRNVLGASYMLMALVYNPFYELSFSATNLILANTISAVILLSSILSWHFLSYKFAALYNDSNYEDAEKVAIKAFEFAREIVGMNHSMTFSSLDDLIDTYKANLKYKEAIMLIEYVLSVYSSLKGFNQHKLATLNSDLTELSKFVPSDLNVKLLSCTEKVSPSPKPTEQEQLPGESKGQSSLIKVARRLVGTAFSYSMQHKFDEAAKLMKYAVSICEEAEGSSVIDLCQPKQVKNKEEEQDILIAELFESSVSSHEPFHWPPKKITSKKKLLKKAYAFG